MRDLAPAGELTSLQTYPFEFDNVEMQYDSYRGLQVRLRCAPSRLRALLSRPPVCVGRRGRLPKATSHFVCSAAGPCAGQGQAAQEPGKTAGRRAA